MQSLKTALAASSSKSIRRLSCLAAISTVFCASHAFAAVPVVVTDAQQTIGSGFNDPQGIAVAPNGTVYVADTLNNQIVMLNPNLPGNLSSAVVPTGTLYLPQGLAVDAAGDLFIGDFQNLSARILEVVASGGVLTNTVKTIYSGGFLNQAISLAINSANPAFANTLFVGDSPVFGGGAIYSINLGSKTPTPVQVSIKGLPQSFTPSALVLDGLGNLYIANSANGGGVYVAPATGGGTAQSIRTGNFNIYQPQGLALDASGDLFILSQLSGFSAPNGEQVIEVPGASPTVQSTPYIIPTLNLETGGGMALDPSGNLDVAEVGTSGFGFPSGNGLVTQLDFRNPVYLGAANVYGNNGFGVVFNFEFNSSAMFSGFTAVTVGDSGSNSDVIEVPAQKHGPQTGNCQFGRLTGLTAYQPYTCYQTFEATPQYVGTRVSAIQVQGSGSAILSSSPVYELGNAAAQIAYPLDVSMTQLGLIQPQGVAISGFNNKVYVADLSGGKVYSINGLNGSQANAVFTGAAGSATALSAPSAVAMNGEGDLFIADFNLHEVIVVPTKTGIAPYVLNTGSVQLQHPISLAIDELGDLYIGDAGADGDDATSAAPGFVVDVPYNASAFQVPINGVSIIFPQALAINPINGDLLIGDGGDGNNDGQIVQVTPAGAASVLSTTNPAPGTPPLATPTNPDGLAFDAAGDLYILDGTLNTITELYTNQTSALLAIANPASLSYPSALASSAGSQSFVVTNLGGGTSNSLVYLNGNSVSFGFGNQANNSVSSSQTATVANIGNQPMTLSNNSYYNPNPMPGFGLGTTTTCANGDIYSSLTSCLFAVAFEPTSEFSGAQSEQARIMSNAYNSGTPIINLTGTGTGSGPGPLVRTKLKAVPQTLPSSNKRRKSFAAAKFK
jgi:sugar lactone lactonase YvrE